MKSDGNALAYIGLKLQYFLAVNNPKSLNSVLLSANEKLMKMRSVLIVKANHQRAVFLILNAKLFASLLHHLGAANVEKRLKCALLCVIACVNYGAVCPRCAHGNVGLLFQHHNAGVVS